MATAQPDRRIRILNHLQRMDTPLLERLVAVGVRIQRLDDPESCVLRLLSRETHALLAPVIQRLEAHGNAEHARVGTQARADSQNRTHSRAPEPKPVRDSEPQLEPARSIEPSPAPQAPTDSGMRVLNGAGHPLASSPLREPEILPRAEPDSTSAGGVRGQLQPHIDLWLSGLRPDVLRGERVQLIVRDAPLLDGILATSSNRGTWTWGRARNATLSINLTRTVLEGLLDGRFDLRWLQNGDLVSSDPLKLQVLAMGMSPSLGAS